MICSRALRLALPLAAAALLAGCASASSGTGAGAPASSGPASRAPASAGPASSAPSPAARAAVYLAEGGTVTGTHEYRPACAKGCLLSGDSTAAMWNMTWPTWDAAEAVGTGTEKIDDCTPNCAAGTVHSVAVRVTLTGPATAECAGRSTRYWTRVSFSWPRGLPPALSGGNGPANPLIYAGIGGSAGCA